MWVGNVESDWIKYRYVKCRYVWVLIVFIFSSLFFIIDIDLI